MLNELYFNPIIPVWIMLLLLAVPFLLFVASMILRKRPWQETAFSSLRVFLVLAFCFIINLRIMRAGDEANLETRNIDVLFVVDTTISMWAQDYNGTHERMDGVIEDCNHIMEKLAGANFGLIRFDNRGQILAPFTQDTRNISDAFDTIRAPDRDYATGSDMSVAFAPMKDLLESSASKENRKTVVFFISDGEITNNAMLASFAPLAAYIDSGAVLGYGTSAGGKMREAGYSSYVYDPETDAAAVSRIDEANLKQIAADLGVDYIHMEESVRVDGIIQYIRTLAKATVTEAKIETFEDTYYFAVIPLLLLLIIELVRHVMKNQL